MCREDDVEDSSTMVSDLIAMCVWQLVNQSVCPEHPEFPTNSSGAAALFRDGCGWLRIEQLL
jgi:hypothetical protein